ncbi:hypothetical protein [Allokutzneria sp. NRRL B-24872]|uniref:hypothetical protein n=1 Tax=Allokutzneria sp. NRRL B-24872 TaxID=1137961 RepID=UPI000A3A782C|nr:hypothetical protein [Allokutzneria sp. NRRL B-24872]
MADSSAGEGDPARRARTFSANTLAYRRSLVAVPEVGRRAGRVDVAVTGTVLPTRLRQRSSP